MGLAPPADSSATNKAAAALLGAVLLLAALLAAGLAARRVQSGLLGHPFTGPAGIAAFLAAGAALSAAGVPRQAVAFAGGYAFGLWPGLAAALLAQMLGCAVDFWLARTGLRRWAMRRIGAGGAGRLARLDRFLAARPFRATLTLRLLPVGNNVALNLAAGVSGMAPVPFLAATLVGYLPQTLVFCLAGSGTQLDRARQLALAAGLFVAAAVLGVSLLRGRAATVAQ